MSAIAEAIVIVANLALVAAIVWIVTQINK